VAVCVWGVGDTEVRVAGVGAALADFHRWRLAPAAEVATTWPSAHDAVLALAVQDSGARSAGVLAAQLLRRLWPTLWADEAAPPGASAVGQPPVSARVLEQAIEAVAARVDYGRGGQVPPTPFPSR
jgi:hypothetical protein